MKRNAGRAATDEELDTDILDGEDEANWMGSSDHSDDLWDVDDEDDSVDELDHEVSSDVEDEKPEPTLRETFTPLALQKLPAKMRDRALSAQANDWIISTIGRLVEAQPSEDSPVRRDIAALIDAAETREIAHMLSDHTLEEAYRLARSVPMPETADTHAAATEAIGVAGNLPGEPAVTAMVVELSIADISPDPDQPRDEGADTEIGDEIRPDTLLPPIEVRRHPNPMAAGGTTWMIVDGERRYRGSLKAGRTTIRAIVNERPMDAGDLLLRQSALNTGKRLKPLEEARTWKRICESKGWSASQLADYLKKPRSTVADRIAILEAPVAFQQLFIDGVLSAAAAPIVRQYAEVPARIIERAIANAKSTFNWREAIEDGKPVPLSDVKRELEYLILDDELREISAELRDAYKGETVKVGKKTYALNADAYDQLEAKHRAAAQSSSKPVAKPAPTQYQLEERKRRAAQKKKTELRQAQFEILSAKLPTTLAGPWVMPVIAWVVAEMTSDTLRAAAKYFKLEVPKGRHGGMRFDAAILEYAEDLAPGSQVRVLLQLLLANDLVVSSYSSGGADRFARAAKLLGIDLGKVKVTDPAKPAAASKPASGKKKSEKRGGGLNGAVGKASSSRSTMKRKPHAVFVQPRQPKPLLAAIVGDKPLPRTEITKKLWAYIKKNGLQDQKERRLINADGKLKPLFGGKSKVSMFEMTKLVNRQIKN